MTDTVKILNKAGLHARPASLLAQTAAGFKSKIELENKGRKVDAKSMLMIMSLGLAHGDTVKIEADGEDAAAAVRAIVQLIESKFAEE